MGEREKIISKLSGNLGIRRLGDLDLKTIANERIIPAGAWAVLLRATRRQGTLIYWHGARHSRVSQTHRTADNERTLCGLDIYPPRIYRTVITGKHGPVASCRRCAEIAGILVRGRKIADTQPDAEKIDSVLDSLQGGSMTLAEGAAALAGGGHV